MRQTINKYGKPVWEDVKEDDIFDINCFYEVPNESFGVYNDDKQVAFHTNLGSITVLDRMTGFGYRDVETGFLDSRGEFWLASGNKDVREAGYKTIGEAIAWIKKNANTCVGDS